MATQPLDVQIIGPSLDEIRELLGVKAELRAGAEVPLPEGAKLQVQDVSKSSGFDATTVLLTAAVSVATSTSSALLIEWLKSKLLASRGGASRAPSITIVVNGNELKVATGD